jgi:hypothetical protein
MTELAGFGIELGTVRMRANKHRFVYGDTSSSLFQGIIYADTASRGKGVAARYLCSSRQAPLKPVKTVVMLDDRREELERVQDACKTMGVDFHGFHLTSSGSKKK